MSANFVSISLTPNMSTSLQKEDQAHGFVINTYCLLQTDGKNIHKDKNCFYIHVAIV